MAHSVSPFGMPIERRGLRASPFGDLYHHVLDTSWWQFFAISVVIYLSTNAFFAFLYYIGGESIVNAEIYSYWEAFAFSFQTSSTIGYGHYQPANAYAHTIVIFDTISGITFVAITTGLAFAKFSRPTAKVIFSQKAVITKYDGQPTFMFRVANARNSHINGASIEVSALMRKDTVEGHTMRRLYDLKLARQKSPVFFLSWTVIHTIDEQSPLFGISEAAMKDMDLSIIVTLTGVEATSSQLVHDHHLYQVSDIEHQKYFADIIDTHPDGRIVMDYGQFHQTLPCD